MLGLELPIFGFSHCRDVVAAVSSAGGIGVLGAAHHSPEELEIHLDHLDKDLAGKPYGVDLVLPSKYLGDDEAALSAEIPTGHREFVTRTMARLGIPEPADPDQHSSQGDGQINTHDRARAHWEVVRRHRPHLLATALGPAPPDIAEECHQAGMLLAGLVGSPRHAVKHEAAGTDIVIAQGTEAGGHTGSTTTFVLVPQVVDAVSVPVLAAGGVCDGRQVAAALALGAEGVWAGSVWLTTAESEVHPVIKRKLVGATSGDAVISRCRTGKPVRQLHTPWVEAWEAADAPPPLPAPLQGLLCRPALMGMAQSRPDLLTTPVGQVVGMIHTETRVKDVIYSMAETTGTAFDRLAQILG